MPAWPTELPPPQWDGFQADFQDNVTRSQMDSGPGKTRRRFTAVSMYYPLTWMFTRPQLYKFVNWFGADIASGSLSFDWIHPLTGGLTKARFRKPPSIKPVGDQRLHSSTALTTQSSNQALSIPAAAAGETVHTIEGLWQVTGELEVLP